MKRSDYRSGLTDEAWDEAKSQLRAAILDAARERRMTSCGEVARR